MRARVELVIDKTVRGLCARPYLGHPKGCPNFNDNPARVPPCPPFAPFVEDALDVALPVYAVWNIFDLAEQKERMWRVHPNWSERQAVCCLYWQKGARKALSGKIASFMNYKKGLIALMCPEAYGINITATMKSVGVELEWPPQNIAYQIAIVGFKKEKSK